MARWQYEITWSRMAEGDLGVDSGQVTGGAGGIANDLIQGMARQLQGNDWELVSHDLTQLNIGLVISLTWRRQVD
jgi:hypothetical protein